MSLTEQLQSDLKEAMRSGATLDRDTLRMALAAIKNRRIELGEDPDDAAVLAVLEKQVKTRQDSVEQYEAAGREDLAATERAEIAVLIGYLPAKLGEDEVRRLVQAKIEELGLTSKREMGSLMKAVMAENKGQVDGKLVQALAASLLA